VNVLDDLNKWINTIVVTIIFVTFIDILMPSNSMKKYTKLIMGLLVMAVILQPLLVFLKKDYSLSSYSFKYQGQMESEYIKKQSENYSASQQEALARLYKEKLETEMTEQIKKIADNKNVKVSVDIVDDMDSENFGDIKKVTVTLGKNIKAIENVEKVDISGKNTGGKPEKQQGDLDLKKRISTLYGIDVNKIEIKYEN
jgi:stage III sporulation protein AF